MNKKELFGGALISYGAMVFNIVSGLLYTPWMLRVIGDDQYALFTLALSVINLFLMDFGISSSVSKFLSEFYAQGREDQANRFMGVVYKVFFIISAVIAVCLTVVYFLIDTIYVKLSPTEIATFKHLFIIVSVFSVLTFPCTTFSGALMANERFIAVKLCDLGQKVLSVLLIVIFLYFGFGLYAMVLIHVLSNLIFCAIKYLCIRKRTTLRPDFSGSIPGMGTRLFSFSLWTTVSSLAQRCMSSIMPTLIAMLLGSVEITVFTLACALEGYVYSIATAINGMFMPRVSRIFVEDDTERELSLLMSRVGRFHIYTIGLLFIGFVSIGQQFISLWVGPGYEAMYVCAVALIFPNLIALPQEVANTALLAQNVFKETAFIQVGKAVVNIMLSFLFISTLGIPGAAISICISNLLATAATNFLYHKRLPVNLPQYFQIVYGRWSIVAVLSTAAGVAMHKWWHPAGWIGLGIQAVCIGLIYAVLTFVVGMRKDEKQHLWEHVQNLISHF